MNLAGQTAFVTGGQGYRKSYLSHFDKREKERK
jgi:hypothetical protein